MQDIVQWCYRVYVYNPSFIGDDILSHDVYHVSNEDRIVFFCDKRTQIAWSERDFREFVDYMLKSTEIH